MERGSEKYVELWRTVEDALVEGFEAGLTFSEARTWLECAWDLYKEEKKERLEEFFRGGIMKKKREEKRKGKERR